MWHKLGESQKYFRLKSQIKFDSEWFHFSEMSRESKCVEAEWTIWVALGWVGMDYKWHLVSLKLDGDAIK